MADDIRLVLSVDDRDLLRARKEQEKYQYRIAQIEKEFRKGTITSSRYNKELANQARELAKLGGGYNKANSEIRKYAYSLRNATDDQLNLAQAMAKSGKGMRRMEILAQQAGYQIGDFAVQVQSGTNVAVAFGQQASQLLGFFGPMGAVAGAGIAIGTGLIAPLLNAKGATRDLSEELEELETSLGKVAISAEASISAGLTANLVAAQSAVNELVSRMQSEDFQRAMSFAGASTASGQVAQTIVAAELEGRKGVVAELENQVGQAAILETQERVRKALIGDQVQEAKNLTDAQRLIRDAESERAEKAQEILDKVSKTLTLKGLEASLLKAELSYGKDSYEFRKISYDVEQARYKLELQNGNYTKGQIRDLIKANGEVLSLKYQISKQDQDTIDLVNTLNYQYSLVEDELKQIKSEQEALNKEAEKLGDHLGIGFERALEIILRAKEEAAMGLDPFGGYGSFKYGGSTKVKPDKPKTTKRDPLADLQKQIELEQALVGKTEARKRIIQALGVDFEKYGDKTINNLEAQINKTIMLEEAERKRQEVVEEAKQQQEALAQSIGSSFESAMMSIVDGTKSVEDAFRTMAAEIIKELYRVFVVKQITGFITDAVGASMAGPVQGPMLPSANGNVFSRGSLVPYANGGVVGSPTLFPMAGGRTGLMGEAGPEAIMPLKRGKGGKLGVAAEGGQQSVVINQNFSFAANGDDSVKRIIAQQAPKIAQMTQQQIMDSRRRGGQMKAVFG